MTRNTVLPLNFLLFISAAISTEITIHSGVVNKRNNVFTMESRKAFLYVGWVNSSIYRSNPSNFMRPEIGLKLVKLHPNETTMQTRVNTTKPMISGETNASAVIFSRLTSFPSFCFFIAASVTLSNTRSSRQERPGKKARTLPELLAPSFLPYTAPTD